MNWNMVWAILKLDLPASFKAWVEDNYDPPSLGTSLDNIKMGVVDSLQEWGTVAPQEYQAWVATGKVVDNAPATGGITTDPSTGWQSVESNGKTYVRKPVIKDGVVVQDPSTKQPAYGQWEAQPSTQSPTDAPTKNTVEPYLWNGYAWERNPWYQEPAPQQGDMPNMGTDQPLYWNGNQWVQNPNYADPNTLARQAAIDAENQKMNLWNIQRDLLADAQNRQKMEWDAIQSRQSAQAAQDLRDAAALNEAEARWAQPDAPKFTSNAPVDWISVWKSNQQPNQQGQRASAFQYYDKMLNGAQTAKLAQSTGTSLERQNIWDNAAQAYRKETDFEFDYRTRVQPIRQMVEGTGPASAFSQGIQEYSPAQANIQWGREQGLTGNAMDAFTNAQREYKPVGPQRPGFLSGVVGTQGGSVARLENVGGTGNYNPWKNQVNLNTLGRTGNAVAPVSAQMFQGWTPSQQQGYQGLVNSRVRGSVGGGNEDFVANVNNMWTASKTGSKATRRW